MTKTILCDKCNGRGYFTFEQSGADYAGVTVLRCEVCQGSGMLEVPITNADHIRSMTDEELADFMSAFCEMSDDCKKCPLFGGCPESDQACWWEEWLKQPYKEAT